ncbi:hypothetical protein [Microbispora sp. ATCC PTA-5024]|uniref:hypothetical protein n=1 Tax=Microbispora sp. ATCC PTA-5024 TaxID=316330 RepID=UPI0003DDEFDA|nr:hypothetical protein [Microbispora sp. ATCC PTA-5024]ETK36721.1 hypothetical protein MPTA5024_07560 [Microbispora sp. ATCC PTA-5024]
MTVDRRVKGEWTQVSSAAAPVDLAAGRWYAVRVSARGPLITITVNGAREGPAPRRAGPAGL